MRASLSVLFILLAIFSITCAHNPHYHCTHDDEDQDIQFAEVEEDKSSLEQGRVLTSSNYTNIRIYTYYEFVKQSAPSAYASYIQNELVPPAIDYFQAALKVKYPVKGNLALKTDKICEKNTPDVLMSGVAADFFIYYDTQATNSPQIASTKYCFLSAGSKRPLVARTVLNRNLLPNANGDVLLHEKNMYVVMHELMHAFGFSTNTYKFFVDANGETLTGHMKSVKIGGVTRPVLDVAPLTEKLRTHFGCPALQGAIMENGGGSGTSASHFERKIFMYEFMTSGSITGRRISELSLALLEGSGWYVPDYTYAEPFYFGKGQGCSFVTGTTCAFDEFCDSANRGCAPTGRGGGYCNADTSSDGCKYFLPLDEYDCENENGADFARLPDVEVYGRDVGSKCFDGSLNTRASKTMTAMCFKYTCSGTDANTKLQIQIGSQQVTCTEEGPMIVDGYYGSVNCPDPLTFCSTVGKKYCPRNCLGRGSCVDGTCQCNPGFYGIDCALNE